MTRQARSGPGNTGASDSRPAPELVCFDVGEVLIDETRVWTVWAEILGVSPFALHAVIGAAIVQGETHTAALPFVAPNLDWRGLTAEHERRLGGLTASDLYPDVRTCLQDLRAAGIRVAIAGNQPAARRDQLLGMGLACDLVTTSEHLGSEKPDPAFFTTLVEHLAPLAGTDDPERMLYVGDRVDHDILPALECGLPVCWLRRGPWGLLHDLPDGVVPDLVLEGLGELPELVMAWRGGGGTG